jgi:NAD(P)-dependent dehydrogenase (short-subunit alcohol dehydrogenase family)
MKIIVIGGTGRIGGNVVRRLVAHGHDAVPASPDTGVDTITGEGLADVVTGGDVVVDVSNAPIWDDDAVLEFFTTSTRNLLAAERDAGIGHHLALTIVGADRCPTAAICVRRSPRRRGSKPGGSRTPSCAPRSSWNSCHRPSRPAPRAIASGCRPG